MANRFANALIEQGIQRGDRVAIYLPNSIEAVAGIYGILKAGAVCVPLNATMKWGKLHYILDNCQASGLLTDARGARYIFEGLRESTPHVKFVAVVGAEGLKSYQEKGVLDFEEIQKRYLDWCPPTSNIDLDLAFLIYTSGSTGEPKGVMCDHSSVVFVSESVMTYLDWSESDIVLNVLPLSYGYGLYQVLMTFTTGSTLVLENSFAYPMTLIRHIVEEQVTGFPGVPAVFARLLQMDPNGFDFSSLRYITNAGAALPVSHLALLRERFPNVKIFSMYGMTETKRTLYLPPDQLNSRPESVGIAIPGTEVWIEGPNGRRLGPNEIGELVVRGRHVMRGYWGAPEATAERFRNGPVPGERLCYSGDLFRMDEDGYFYFVSRKDDIIKTRGEKVAPKEIENVLHDLDGVVEAAVIGVPDPVFGQAVKAFVVGNNDKLTVQRVLAHCRAHLEDFMLPKYVEFRNELPRTGTGKVLKSELH